MIKLNDLEESVESSAYERKEKELHTVDWETPGKNKVDMNKAKIRKTQLVSGKEFTGRT